MATIDNKKLFISSPLKMPQTTQSKGNGMPTISQFVSGVWAGWGKHQHVQ
jgi:hypothetical protein